MMFYLLMLMTVTVDPVLPSISIFSPTVYKELDQKYALFTRTKAAVGKFRLTYEENIKFICCLRHSHLHCGHLHGRCERGESRSRPCGELHLNNGEHVHAKFREDHKTSSILGITDDCHTLSTYAGSWLFFGFSPFESMEVADTM